MTNDVGDVAGLSELLEEIRPVAKVDTSTHHVPAVVGELAGTALKILISQPAQAILALVAFGELLWKIIDFLRKRGKKLLISKELATPLVANKAMEDLGNEFKESSDSVRIWGPMEAQLTDGPVVNCIEEYKEAFGPMGYFIAIAITRPNNRIKTIYYLLGAGGKLCGSWTTQTLSERVPDFLRPS